LRPELSGQLGEYICIPVIAHGDTADLLHINFAATDKPSVAKALGQFATRWAGHISMAIANVKLRDELHDQSVRDPLTGLYNRRYFMDAMRREAVSSDRGEKGFGLISFDADKFKTFNDNHGHEAGDMVLRALAERMFTVMPDDAICARIGGEEFAIPVPKTDLDEALACAERLRRDVEAIEVRTAFGPLPRVTISPGVVAYDGGAPRQAF
jgi:diguanylate cyclase (GGDEF)-like protein